MSISLICQYLETSRCHSCSLLKLPYPEQLQIKLSHLTELLKAHSVDTPEIPMVIPSDPIFGSRARAKMVVNLEKGELSVGILDDEMDGIDISGCPLHEPELKELILVVRHELKRIKIKPYDIKQRTGELKYVLARRLPNTGEMILRFVARSEKIREDLTNLAAVLMKQITELKIVTLNIQPVPMAIVEGDQEVLLLGQKSLTEQLGELKFSVSPQSFSQVTPNVALKLYQRVASRVAASKVESVWDLYCGGGYLSQFSAKSFNDCLGVEISKTAIEDAKISTEINGISNIQYLAMDSYEFLANKSKAPDLIILNPPRRGLGEKICNELIRLKPKHIIYSSCNAETLVKDLNQLKASYRVTLIQQFDMFPLTPSYETLTTLSHF